ncbi:MAG TPA: hypothetical protein PKD53_27450 [Chloroflexaceae bacterium]|nr:hypothetical protein [Chloroflexaceae bacterium]
MKKIRSLLLTLLLGLALAACGGPGNTTTNPNADSPLAGDETPQAGEGGTLGSDPAATPVP